MSQTRTTYPAQPESYSLDPDRIFDVVADLELYLRVASDQAQHDNQGMLKPASYLAGNGRTLTVSTDAVDQRGFLKSFNLANLVSDADGPLRFDVSDHPGVAIPSDHLHVIAQRYALNE